jgi:hypothetical protein
VKNARFSTRTTSVGERVSADRRGKLMPHWFGAETGRAANL